MSINDIANKHKVDVNILKQELKKGIKVEHEHTSDVKKAARIAMDHLFEDPKYYTKLDKIGLEEFEEIPDVEAVETVDVSKGFIDYNPQNLNVGEEIYYSFDGKSYHKGKVVNRPSSAKPNVYTIKNTNGIPTVIIYGGDRTNVRLKKKSLNENQLNQDLIKEFLKACMLELGIIKLPKITLSNDSQEAIDMRSWGGYMPSKKAIHIVTAKRHPADIFRTLAHELVHYKQDLEGRLKPGSGETGSDDENEANSKAAVIMRNFAQEKPNLFEHLLKEVGDIVNAFPWKYDFVDDDGNFFYTFNTPENKYSVGITYNGGNSYEILFNTAEEMGKDTGENVATRVISTVFEIMLDFINKENPDDLIIRPTEEKRGRIYRHYAEKNIPDGYKLISIGDTQHWIKK